MSPPNCPPWCLPRARGSTVRTGPARALLEATREASGVIGARRRGNESGLRLGQVAYALLHRSHCPVPEPRPEPLQVPLDSATFEPKKTGATATETGRVAAIACGALSPGRSAAHGTCGPSCRRGRPREGPIAPRKETDSRLMSRTVIVGLHDATLRVVHAADATYAYRPFAGEAGPPPGADRSGACRRRHQRGTRRRSVA